MINTLHMKKKTRFFFASVVLSFSWMAVISSESAQAFPGMIRHGYVNCTSCHVQSTGGGVLTSYGRGLSEEVLSTWSKEGEGKFLYNAFGVADAIPEKKVQVGGDTRLIQTYKNSSFLKEERFFLMQADVEAAAEFGKFTLDASLGYYDGEGKSLRHYLSYQAADDIAIRVGRFRPAYGINTPEHTIVIKRNLQWDESMETYNIEAAFLKSGWNAYLTAMLGKPESVETEEGLSVGRTGVAEKGFAGRGSVFLAERYELGLEYYYGNNASGARHVAGPFAILGFGPHVYLLSELDFQFSKQLDPSQLSYVKGLFNYQKLSYEPFQGFHLIATTELARPDFTRSASLLERYGAGIEFYPRPHWEIQALWHKQRQAPGYSGFQDLAWLMVHFYL